MMTPFYTLTTIVNYVVAYLVTEGINMIYKVNVQRNKF